MSTNRTTRLRLDSGWQAKKASMVAVSGAQLTDTQLPTDGLPAIVPGTILTTLVRNQKFSDPYYGLNNDSMPEISDSQVGPEYYTYWFYTTFDLPSDAVSRLIWLTFRGINYRADVYLNGRQVNPEPLAGMFRVYVFNITELATAVNNRLAVLLWPPEPPGIPAPPPNGRNGGQDGVTNIGNSVTMRYPVGGTGRSPYAIAIQGSGTRSIWRRPDQYGSNTSTSSASCSTSRETSTTLRQYPCRSN